MTRGIGHASDIKRLDGPADFLAQPVNLGDRKWLMRHVAKLLKLF